MIYIGLLGTKRLHSVFAPREPDSAVGQGDNHGYSSVVAVNMRWIVVVRPCCETNAVEGLRSHRDTVTLLQQRHNLKSGDEGFLFLGGFAGEDAGFQIGFGF
jgi:hypothetical protein